MVTSTRYCAGTTSSRWDRSSPILTISPQPQGQSLGLRFDNPLDARQMGRQRAMGLRPLGRVRRRRLVGRGALLVTGLRLGDGGLVRHRARTDGASMAHPRAPARAGRGGASPSAARTGRGASRAGASPAAPHRPSGRPSPPRGGDALRARRPVRRAPPRALRCNAAISAMSAAAGMAADYQSR